MIFLFGLPFKLPSLNEWEKLHKMKRYAFKKRIAENIFPEVHNYKRAGYLFKPLSMVDIKVIVYRKQIITDPHDNKPAGLKPLLDALQPPIMVTPTKNYPDGMKAGWRQAVILNDDDKCIPNPIEYKQVQDSFNERTSISITDIS